MAKLSSAILFLWLCGFIAPAQAAPGWDTPQKKTPELEVAPDLAKIASLQDAVAEAWLKMPLTQRRAIFVAKKPDSYGSFEERKSHIFKPGETLVTYVEPIGYTWVANPTGGYDYGISTDFVVKRPSGEILGGQEKLLDVAKTSQIRNQELMVVLSLTLDRFTPGDYIVEYKMHDGQSAKESKFQQAFTIAP